MRDDATLAAGDWRTAFWLTAAAGIVPAMFVLPLYVLPIYVPFAGRHVNTFDGRRLIEIGWAAALLLALARPSVRLAAGRLWGGLSPYTRAAGGLFIGWALVSALASAAPAYALREWGLLVLLLVVVFPLSLILDARHRGVLEVLAVTLALYAILLFRTPLEHGFTHPRFLGQALAVTAPVLLFSGHRGLALLAAPALALGFLNGSRALPLAILAAALAATVLWPGRARRVLPGLVAIAVAAVLVAIPARLGHDAALEAAIERATSLTGRDTMWKDALARFTGAPILGVGPGLLARGGVAGWAAHPHNSILLIAAETGLVGLSFVAVLVGRGLMALPRLEATRRPWALGLLAGGVHSMFSGTIVMPASQALLVLALALVVGGPPTSPPRPGRAPRAGWALTAVGAAALVALLLTLNLPSADLRPGTYSGPRFFSGGILP